MLPAIQELFSVIRTYYSPREDHTDAVVKTISMQPKSKYYRASCPATLFDLETKFMRDVDKETREALIRHLKLYRFDKPATISIDLDGCIYVFEIVENTKQPKQEKQEEMR